MEENNKQLKSIFGKWWLPVRKWFYPIWLSTELSIRFYDYTLSVNDYFIGKQALYVSYIGEIGLQILANFCSSFTFIICTAFLTVPACLVLYQFFKIDNITVTSFEAKVKRFL